MDLQTNVAGRKQSIEKAFTRAHRALGTAHHGGLVKISNAASAAAALAMMTAGAVFAQQASQPSPPERLIVNIDARQTASPVSPYEYGMFIEHIGQLIYHSLWSEMLDDRKFYFPIKPEEPPAAAPAQGGPFRNMQLRKWHPIGPADTVMMDKDQPFVGEQSPRIELNASTPHGIRQSGFALVKGKKYTGHIWLRATPGAKVTLTMVWGEGANDHKTATIPAPPSRSEE